MASLRQFGFGSLLNSLPLHLDIFLNPIPQLNPNELALSRIIPPPTIHSQRSAAMQRLMRMQEELCPQPVHKAAVTDEVEVRRIA